MQNGVQRFKCIRFVCTYEMTYSISVKAWTANDVTIKALMSSSRNKQTIGYIYTVFRGVLSQLSEHNEMFDWPLWGWACSRACCVKQLHRNEWRTVVLEWRRTYRSLVRFVIRCSLSNLESGWSVRQSFIELVVCSWMQNESHGGDHC